MQIAIIGAGNVGKALATGWIAAGHKVTFGVRTPESPANGPAGAGYASVADAARGAEVVVLATPWPAVPEAIAAAGDLTGKVLIDCTNPLRVDAAGMSLDIGFATSGGEQVAALAAAASVFKTLNQTGSDNMQRGKAFVPLSAAMFVAGDDEAKKPLVMSLVSDLDFQAIDAGPLQAARLLEPLATLWIHMAFKRGMPPTRAFTLTDRP